MDDCCHLWKPDTRVLLVNELVSHHDGGDDFPFTTGVVVVKEDFRWRVCQVDFVRSVGPRAKDHLTRLLVVGIEGDVNLARGVKGPGRLPAHVAVVSYDGPVLRKVWEVTLHSEEKVGIITI